jgi:hypothetical protein
MRRLTVFASLSLFIAVLLAAWVYSRQAEPVALTPMLTGQVEYCLTCHADLPEISPSHPIKTFGCVVCHGGERLALDAGLAHSTMRGGDNPSDLAVVEASCGGEACHSGTAADERDHIQRVRSSVQATYAGAIANIRYTFGAQPDQTARLGIYAIRAPEYTPGGPGVEALEAFDPAAETSVAILAFAENCLNCHLSAPYPAGTQDTAYARLTGCAACHSLTAGASLEQPLHNLTIAMPYTQCNTCHNRGNYDLRSMQFVPRADHPSSRIQDYYQPIAQFVRCEWTLDCSDCHTRQEAMGDGHIYSNKKEIQYVRCFTCHGTLEELPRTYTITDPNDLALRLAFLNPVIDLKVGDTIIATEKGEPMWNARQLPDGSFELFGKATRQRFAFRPVKGSACQQKSDEQESRYCHACHAVER